MKKSVVKKEKAHKYKRILLKLSGEALKGDQPTGLNPKSIDYLAHQVVQVHKLGVETALVIGAGNLVRGHEFEAAGMKRVQADYMGMLSTIINSMALQDAIERLGIEVRVMTAIDMAQIAEPYIRRRAIRHLELGRVVILAGGTGNPFFTTDTTAALRAAEIEAEIIFKATKVDGVYSADPKKDPNAKFYDKLTYMDVLKNQLKVMDAAAISLCQENHIPIRVINMNVPGNVIAAIKGKPIGTLVAD